MALGAATAVGFDGSKFLNEDTVTKLQDAEKKIKLDRTKKELEKNTLKQKDLTAITTIISKLKTSIQDLGDETNFLKRKVDSTGESATLSAVSGVSLQSLDIDVKQLAQRDSYKSVNFKSKNDLLGLDKDTTLSLRIDGTDYDINLKKNSSLQDLADFINEKTGGNIQAKLVNVGGDKPYQMVLQSTKTGKNQSIEFKEIGDSNLFEKVFGIKNSDTKRTQVMQDSSQDGDSEPKQINGKNVFKFDLSDMKLTTAQDAQFEYNGLNITRSENTINDLRTGITLTLKKEGKSSFNVTQDNETLKESMKEMVSSYNELINNLDVSLAYDEKTKSAGTFQGVSEISEIRSKINKILSSTIQREKTESEFQSSVAENNSLTGQASSVNDLRTKTLSISDFGLTIEKNGLLKLDESVLNTKLSQEGHNGIRDVSLFFVGEVKQNTITHTGKEINSGALEFGKNDIFIDGVAVEFKTDANSSAEDNAKAFIKAVNDAGIEGVGISIVEGKLFFKRSDGFNIDISGKKESLEKLGLSATEIQATSVSQKGIFAQLTDTVNSLIDSKNGSLTLYANRLKKESKDADEDIKKVEEKIKEKFDIMREQFIRYEQAMRKVQNMWQPVETMINYELAKK